MILAVDLDGTFLGGPEEDRQLLYQLLRDTDATLIYVTGRGVESILPVIDNPQVPSPDYIIADVGGTVVDGNGQKPIQPLQTEIAKGWPGTHKILDALSDYEYLERQDVPQEHRASFLVEESDIDDDLRTLVEDLGCQLVFSANQYLDVLPEGASKGTTLLRLLDQEGFDREEVVVAGDTLNDRSMFETGLKGIVVGNAERALFDAVEGNPHVYRANRPGAGGILEGLHSFGFLDSVTFEKLVERDEVEAGPSQLVMVYHRLPFEEEYVDGELVRRPVSSPNGIIPTLLGFFRKGRRGSWIAWSKQQSRNPENFESRVPVDARKYPELSAARVPLTSEDVERFYEKFSKEAFWPIIFSFPSKAVFNQEDWEHYVEINQIFADKAAQEAEEGALVWVHDYNLWLVPGMLRQKRPDLRIAFFHHTAFPPSGIFNTMPWRREIVSSLLQCDYVGFHIPRYVENFVDVARTQAPIEVEERVSCAPRFMTYGCALGVNTMTTRLKTDDRTVGLGANPVGIDVDAIADILKRDHIQKQISAIDQQHGDMTRILSVERLDYVKGPLAKLLAFEQMLEDHPELHESVVLINIATPPAKGMEVYQRIREQVDETIGRINGRFSKHGWTPVKYFFRTFPFEEVIAHYAASDVAWITPLRDGLNMVAKEFVATSYLNDGDGALVLSEFAGAAVELHGAILTNPNDRESMTDSLYQALTLAEEDRKSRIERMYDIVRKNDIQNWSEDFLRSVEAV
jgi:glucosylglycerol-phosphate synthase